MRSGLSPILPTAEKAETTMEPSPDPKPYSSSTTPSHGTGGTRLREQAGVVREDLRELGGAAREAAQQKLEDAGRATSQFVDTKKEQLSAYEDELVAYVRSKPVQSVLVAAGIGALLGMFWSRG